MEAFQSFNKESNWESVPPVTPRRKRVSVAAVLAWLPPRWRRRRDGEPRLHSRLHGGVLCTERAGLLKHAKEQASALLFPEGMLPFIVP